MTASFTLDSAAEKIFVALGLLLLSNLVYPAPIVRADNSLQNQEKTALVFNINLQPAKTEQQNTAAPSISINEVANGDIDYQTKQELIKNLQAYFHERNSPMEEFADKMVDLPYWQQAVAISKVESGLAIHCHSNNCSGIGGSPRSASWRRYASKYDWFVDMNNLLEKRYNGWTFRQMKGRYVYPGTNRWVYGAERTFAELEQLKENARTLAIARVSNIGQPVVAVSIDAILAKQ